MTRIITAHGLDFNVEYYGLAHHEDDRDRAVDQLEKYLAGIDVGDLRRDHAASLRWIDSECDGDRPKLFDELEDVAASAATDGWASRESVGFMISATRN